MVKSNKKNYITEHLITDVKRLIKEKSKNHKIPLLFFEEKNIPQINNICKIGKFVHVREGALIKYKDFHVIDGMTLSRLKQLLEDNRFYFYINHEGKSYKARLKRDQ